MCLSVGNRNQLGPTQPVGLPPPPLRPAFLGSQLSPEHQSLRKELAAGLESPGVGSSTPPPRPRHATYPAAHTWLLCTLSLARGQHWPRTDRRTDSQDCVSYAGRAAGGLLRRHSKVKSLVGRQLR